MKTRKIFGLILAAILVISVVGFFLARQYGIAFSPASDKGSDTFLGFVTRNERTAEHAVTEIALAEPLSESRAEIGAMDWYGDYLVMLPQYPNFYNEQSSGAAFALAKADILAYLSAPSIDPLDPIQISFDGVDLSEVIEGYEGYESIVFAGNRVYVTIEAKTENGMTAYLVSGSIAPDLTALTLDASTLASIPSQSGVDNMSDETLLLAGESLVTIHESNGVAINPSPVAHHFDMHLTEIGLIPLSNIEYRLTDASRLDEADRFWVINYLYPGETVLKSEVDPLFEKFGKGDTHNRYPGVERLVEFQYSENSISMTDSPVIQLELLGPESGRNWEGIVRLDDLGFLLVTDKYPRTILGFVPLSDSSP